MPDVLTIGPFMLPSAYLLLLIGIIPGWLIVRFKLNKTLAEDDAVNCADLIVNAAFLWIVLWKFGGIFFHPAIIWENPWGILRLTGTWKECVLATVAAVVYLWLAARKRGQDIGVILDVVPLGLIPVILVRFSFLAEYGTETRLIWGIRYDPASELRYHPVHIYMSLLSLGTWLAMWRHRPGTWRVFTVFLLVFGSGLLLISFVLAGEPEFGAFRGWQLLSLCMIASGLHILMRKQRKGDHDE